MLESVRARGAISKALLSVLVVGIAAMVLSGTFSALSSSTASKGNSLSTGSVSVGDNSSGVAMYADAGLVPGDTVTRCIQVTYTGATNGAMNLYIPDSLDKLASYTNVSVNEFPGASGAPFPECGGARTKPQPVFAGTLADFQAKFNTYDSGLPVSPNPGSGISTWAQDDTAVFQFTLTIDKATPTDSTLTTGDHSWVWEAQG